MGNADMSTKGSMGNPLMVGSLFSGIGGFDLGLEKAGFQIAWQVEIDEYATKVLTKHWPNVTRFRDVRDCGVHNLMPVDLIAGGFPCQPHSVAGRRRASADERDLWGEFYRIICELRPRWVLAENVPGLLSSESGRFFGRVLKDLASCGYDAEWQSIPASAFGAPHIRERVFIVAYPASKQSGRLQQRGIFTDLRASDKDVAYSQCIASQQRRESNQEWGWQEETQQTRMGSSNVPYSDRQSLAVGQVFGSHAAKELTTSQRDCSTGAGIWATESDVGRVAHGVPFRVDRLRGLGNAIVPQIAQFVGKCIMEYLRAESEVA